MSSLIDCKPDMIFKSINQFEYYLVKFHRNLYIQQYVKLLNKILKKNSVTVRSGIERPIYRSESRLVSTKPVFAARKQNAKTETKVAHACRQMVTLNFDENNAGTVKLSVSITELQQICLFSRILSVN